MIFTFLETISWLPTYIQTPNLHTSHDMKQTFNFHTVTVCFPCNILSNMTEYIRTNGLWDERPFGRHQRPARELSTIQFCSGPTDEYFMNLGYTFKQREINIMPELSCCLFFFQTHPVQQVSVDGMFFCSSVKLKVRQWLYRCRAHRSAATAVSSTAALSAQTIELRSARASAAGNSKSTTARKQERL